MKLLLLLAFTTLIVGSTAEYFTASDASDRLAPAAEYQRASDYLKRSSRRKVGNALATAAEYLKAFELPNSYDRVDRVAESLGATVEYMRASDYSKRSSRTRVGNALATAADYFKASALPSHQKRVDRVAESLAATAEYLRAREYPQRVSRIESEDTRAFAAEYFKTPELPRLNIRSD